MPWSVDSDRDMNIKHRITLDLKSLLSGGRLSVPILKLKRARTEDLD